MHEFISIISVLLLGYMCGVTNTVIVKKGFFAKIPTVGLY